VIGGEEGGAEVLWVDQIHTLNGRTGEAGGNLRTVKRGRRKDGGVAGEPLGKLLKKNGSGVLLHVNFEKGKGPSARLRRSQEKNWVGKGQRREFEPNPRWNVGGGNFT